MTYWSAVVDESDLCFLGGVPGDGLRELLGVWEEESQSYYPDESVGIAMTKDNQLGMNGPYAAVDTCSMIHAEGATVLASYASDYLEGQPALTVNRRGKGKAYYIAARTDGTFLNDFYAALARDEGLHCCLSTDIPAGVSVQTRTNGDTDYIFVMNFNDEPQSIELDSSYVDLLTDQTVDATVTLERYGVMVLRAKREIHH